MNKIYCCCQRLLLTLCGVLLASTAWGQVTWVGSTQAAASASPVTSFVINKPASIAFADLLIAQLVVNSATATVTAPTGWSFVDEVISGSVRQRLYYKVAGNGEPTSYTFTVSPSARASGAIMALRGAEMVPPIFASYSESSGTANSLVAAEVVSTRVNSMLVGFFAQANGNASVAANASLTARYSTATGAASNGVSLAAGTELLSYVGPTGGRTASSDQNANYVSQLIALRPAVTSCFSDNFNRTTLGSNWATTTRSGTFTPQIINNRLRMTQNVQNQSTAATLQRLVPAAGNLTSVVFRHYAYGYIASDGAADGMVFVLSDAAVTPQPGGYGGSLGYAPRSGVSGFAGGWLGVGLDEYGNYSNNDEGRSGRPPSWTVPTGSQNPSGGLRQDAVVVRGSMPNYYYLAGTATLNPGVDANTTSTATALPGYLYRITVDSRISGQAWVTVERDTTGVGNSYAILLGPFDALATYSAQQDSGGLSKVPTNFYLSIASGTGSSDNYHEMDDLNVCALSLNTVVPQIDHYRFYHDGSANTCTPEPIRLLACADATCSTLYQGSTTATLAASVSGQWQDSTGNTLAGNQVTFSGGTVNLRLSQTSALTENLNITASTPVTKPLSVPLCFNSSNNTQYADCSLVFSGATTFTFGTAPANVIPAQQAGVESGPIRIQANNSACTGVPSAFNNKTVAVRFWFNYLDASQAAINSYLTSGSKPSLWLDPYEAATNTTQNLYELPTAQASGVARNVYFNSSGIGFVNLVYPDVGQLQLSADVTSQTITGNVAFVVKPYQFTVSNVLRTATNAANPAAADANGAVFANAGEAFTATVTAQNAAHKITDGAGATVVTPLSSFSAYGRTTKLYGKEAVPEGVRVFSDANSLQPAGGANPVLGNSDIPGSSFGSGTSLGMATVSNLSWPEVGIIRLKPLVLPVGSEVTGDYLGGGDVLNYSSPNIGRFIPYEFGLQSVSLVNRWLAPACSKQKDPNEPDYVRYSYMDEAMGLEFTLQARAVGGTVTKNYAGSFAKLDLSGGDANLNFGAAQAVGVAVQPYPLPSAGAALGFAALSGRLSRAGFGGAAVLWPAVGSVAAGQLSLNGTVTVSSLNNAANNRQAVDGPFLKANIGIAPVDSDGVVIRGYDFGTLNNATLDHKILATTALGFGTLRLNPGLSSELLPLTMSEDLLVYNGMGFVPNGNDNCTTLPLQPINAAGLSTWKKNLNAGETCVSATRGGACAVAGSNLVFNQGKGTLWMTAPGVGNNGSVLVTANLAGMPYLQGRWGAGASAFNVNPSATATFGVYRGARQIIHIRENF